MSRCCTCKDLLQDNKPHLMCCECKFLFHVGACSGVSEDSFSSKRDSIKKVWKCISCKPVGKKGANTGNTDSLEMDVRTLLLEMNTKLSSLLSLPEKVDGIEKSIEMLSAEFDRFTVRLDAQEKETKQLKARVVSLEQASDMKLIAEMQAEIDDLEWRSRRLNLEFHGIPKTEPEDLLSKINEIAAQLHLDTLDTQDVAAVHRLPSRPDRIPGVIVRFTRQEVRDKWLAGRRALRIANSNVYVSENMTKRSRDLLSKCKEWIKRSGYAFAWHTNGKILIRKKAGDAAVAVRSEADLAALTA